MTVREKMMEIGLAGWAFHRSILQDKSLALLDLPAVARKGLAYLREHFGGLA